MPGVVVRGAPGRLRVGLACALCLWNTVAAAQGEAKKEAVPALLLTPGSGSEEGEKDKAGAVLAAAELPARAVDLSALNLTELVNDMLGRALKESRRFFSLLSITSYSSFAFHKLSVAVYNISNLKTVDQAKFPTRYCYCLSNRTNDLSDFTALLVDVLGNASSYLTEIFKSTSILSVSQTNASDCIFICVMTGQAGRNLSDLWELAEKSPVLSYTFTSSLAAPPATGRTAAASKLAPTSQQTPPRTSPPRTARGTSAWAEAPGPSEPEQAVSTTASEKTPGGPPWGALSSSATAPTEAKDVGTPAETHGSPSRASPASGTLTPSTQTSSPTKAPAPRYPHTDDLPRPFPAGEAPALVPGPPRVHVSRCPQQLPGEGPVTAGPLPGAAHQLTPCLMELCRFFQQCLCAGPRRDPRTEATRRCPEHYAWFLRNATHICRAVKRVPHAHTLKQRCLENICKSV